MASLMLALPLLAAITRLMASPMAHEENDMMRSSAPHSQRIPSGNNVKTKALPGVGGVPQEESRSPVRARGGAGERLPLLHPLSDARGKSGEGHGAFYWHEAPAIKASVRSGAWGIACILAFGIYASGVAGAIRGVGEFVGLHASLGLLQVSSG